METISGEIILQDLLAWEPQLTVVAPRPSHLAGIDPLRRDVDWVLTARANAPMLPYIRGGELIILPHRIVQETGIPFDRLMGELMMHPIAGILAEQPVPEIPNGPIAVLSLPRIGPETESDLNRLLASHRREVLQIASDADHLIADAIERHARPGELIDALARHIGIPISILTDDSAVLFSTGIGATNIFALDRKHPEWLSAPLKADQTMWVGPIPPDRLAGVRITIGRIRIGIQRLLDRDASSTPHGNARAIALNALLVPEVTTSQDTIADQAFRAGIPPGRTLHVVLAPSTMPDHRIRRLLAPLGDIHDAGSVDGNSAWIVIAAPATGRTPILSSDSAFHGIAISAPLVTARNIPEGTRQARYLARLLAARAIPGPVARFEDNAQLGVYRLLYTHWGSPTLEQFSSALLGPLQKEDRHGTLQKTLRVFLEEGGSLRPTAERLGIHRNTLAYRLRQIRLMVNADLESSHVRLSLHLALVAERLPTAPE